MRNSSQLRFGLILVGLLVLLTGCFGGSSKKRKTAPAPEPTLLHGTVFGPGSLAAKSSARPLNFLRNRVIAASSSLAGEVPLGGVEVLVYDLQDYLANPQGVSPLAQGKTKNDGTYAISGVGTGRDLLVIVPGDPRLSTFVPSPGKQTTANVNSATTFIAEAWAPALREEGVNVPTPQFGDAVAELAHALGGLSGDDLADALAELLPGSFGDGLREADRWQTVAEEIEELTLQGPVACWFITPDTYSAMPGTPVALWGVDPGWHNEDTFARLEVAGFDPDDEWPAPILLEDGEATVGMPIHPVGRLDGGEGRLVVYNEADGVTCPSFDVYIESLPPAPMSLDAVVDQLERAIIQRADAFGYSETDLLQSHPEDLDPHVAGLAFTLQAMAGDHPTSLRNALKAQEFTVGGETYRFSTDDMELVNAVLAANGLHDELLAMADTLQAAPALHASASTVPGAVPWWRQISTASAAPAVARRLGDVSTPAQLATWTGVQAQCAVENSNMKQWERDVVGFGLAVAGVAFPPAAPAAGLSALAVTLMSVIIDMCEEALPTLNHMSIQLQTGQQSFNEDDEGPAPWQADIYVADRQWTLDVPTTLSLLPGAGPLGKTVSKLLKQSKVAAHFNGVAIDMFKDMLATAWSARGGTESGPRTLQADSIGPIRIDPTRTEDREYVTWDLFNLEGERAFEFTHDETEYIPIGVGRSALLVQTVPDAFGHPNIVYAETELEVKQIEIEIVSPLSLDDPGITLPEPFHAEPEEEVLLHAIVKNATNPAVRWSERGGRGDFEVVNDTSAYFRTPPDNFAEYVVKAESTANTGVRRDSATERYGEARVKVGTFGVAPRAGCLEVGDTVQLRASLGFGRLLDFTELDWTQHGPGSLSPDGLYHATGQGEVTFLFSHEDMPGVLAEVNFTIQEECEGFHATLIGAVDADFGGACMMYLGTGNLQMISLGRWSADIWSNTQFRINPGGAVDLQDLKDGRAEFIVVPVQDVMLDYGGYSWSNTWTGQPGTLTLWGETRSVMDGEASEFALSGSWEGPMMGWRIDDPDRRLIEAYAVVEFRGVHSSYGCFDALPSD